MVKAVIYSYIAVILFNSYPCWIINDINTKMLAKKMYIEALDDMREASFLRQISFVFPGTKWCGAGNIADNYDDLGFEKEADMCCRSHDNCPGVIPGGESKYNLTNDVFYTRLSCDCDEKFYNCMKAANTQSAKIIGNIYFNALQTKCYREDYPVLYCTRRGGWFNTKCLEYAFNTDSPKVYQWFDEKEF